MDSLILQFKVIAGSDYMKAARDLAEAASRFGIAVEADFNGTPMTALPGDDPRKVARMWSSMRDALAKIEKRNKRRGSSSTDH